MVHIQAVRANYTLVFACIFVVDGTKVFFTYNVLKHLCITPVLSHLVELSKQTKLILLVYLL